MTNQAFCHPRPLPFSIWWRKLHNTLFSAATEACFCRKKRRIKYRPPLAFMLWVARCHEFKSAIKPLEWSGVSVCCCSDWPERAALPLAWCSSLYTRGWLGCYRTTDGHGTPNTSHTPPEIKKTHVSSLRQRACQITQVWCNIHVHRLCSDAVFW